MADGETARKTKAKSPRAFEIIYEAIRKDLMEGTLKPGDKLPAEREFAEQLGFSRAAVREALRALEATGIVQLHKGVSGGSFVKSGDAQTVTRAINDIVVLGKVPLRQVMEVRSLLLCRAVQLIVEQTTDENLDIIDKNIRDTDIAAATKSRRLRFFVSEFYHILGQLSGNKVLELLIDVTTTISLEFVWNHKIEFSGELIAYRRNVLSRLRARDAVGAARAISENLAFLHGFVIARAAEHQA
jgi:GntR family transcriptional regulator, transcriptional repressor for pyruvate dehydrogenase complex